MVGITLEHAKDLQTVIFVLTNPGVVQEQVTRAVKCAKELGLNNHDGLNFEFFEFDREGWLSHHTEYYRSVVEKVRSSLIADFDTGAV